MLLKLSALFVLAFIGCAMAAPMTTQRLAYMMDFINNVPLAEPKLPYAYNASASVQSDGSHGSTDKKKQGFVVAGQLIPFTANVRGPTKDDVINSCLFSQLAADAKYDKEKDGRDWYKLYASVMTTLGWVMQDFDFAAYQVNGGKFTMDTVVLDIILAIATDSELAVAKEVIGGLKALSDSDNRVVLFSHNSYKDQAGNFMLSPVDQDSNGDVAMGIEGFQFSASQSSTRFLFFEWDSSSTHIYKSTQIITLDETIYNYSRETVISRLGSRAQAGAAEIPLAPLPSE